MASAASPLTAPVTAQSLGLPALCPKPLVEGYARVLAAQKQLTKLDKELPPLRNALQKLKEREDQTPNLEACKASIEKIKIRAQEVYQKQLKAETELADAQAKLAFLMHVEYNEETLHTRMKVIDYFCWRGQVAKAQQLADQWGIPVEAVPRLKQAPKVDPIVEMSQDLTQRHDIGKALAWAEANREELKALNGNLLQVKLSVRKLLCLAQEAAAAAAPAATSAEPTAPSSSPTANVALLPFVANGLLPFAGAHPQLIQDAVNCVAHPIQANYKGLYDEQHWEDCARQLQVDADDLLKRRKPCTTDGKVPPFVAELCLGCFALKDLMHSSHPDYKKVPAGSLRDMITKVATAFDPKDLSVQHSSRFICPVTHFVSQNPRVLSNGTVVSEEGIEYLLREAEAKRRTAAQAPQKSSGDDESRGTTSAGAGSGNGEPPVEVIPPYPMIQCPVTHDWVSAKDTKKVFIV